MRKLLLIIFILFPVLSFAQGRANNRNITIPQVITDVNANNWKLFYSNGVGSIIELSLGADGTVLTSNGAAAGPSFQTAGSSVSQLTDLSDVTTASQTAGYVIISDGGNYYGRALTESDISDLQSYLTSEVDGSVTNELQTIVGDITSTGTTTLTTTIGDDKVLESHLKAVNSPTDEYFLTYESTTGDFEWQTFAYPLHNPVTLGTANGLSLSTQEVSLALASGSSTGALSQTDWTNFNNKADAFSSGNLTESTSSILTITGGTGSVIGSGTSIRVSQATGSTSGYLSSADWNAFNNKVSNATHSGDVSGSTTLTIGADKVLESHLKAVNSPTDEYYLTYEATTGDFEWQDITAGDVSGPGSSTDNALVRFNGTDGTTIQNSGVTLSDLGDMTFTAGDKIYLASNGYNYLMDNGGNMQLRNSQVEGRINFLVGAASVFYVDYDGIDVTGEVDLYGIPEPADGGDGILYHNSSDNKLYWKYNTMVYDLTQSGGGSISLTGDVTGSGTSSIATTIATNAVDESMLNVYDSPGDGEILSWNSSQSKFEWVADQTGSIGVGSASTNELLWNNGGTVDGMYGHYYYSGGGALVIRDGYEINWGTSSDYQMEYYFTNDALVIYGSDGSTILWSIKDGGIMEVSGEVVSPVINVDDYFSFDYQSPNLAILNSSDVSIARIGSGGDMGIDGWFASTGWLGCDGTSTQPANQSGTYQIWFDSDNDKLCWVDAGGNLHIAQEEPPPMPAPSPKPTIPGIDPEDIFGLTTQFNVIEYTPDNTKYRLTTLYYQDGSLVYSKPDPWKRLGIIRKLLLK